ncbi:MAG: type sorting protein [Ferruginibacter sp.]|uniref:zinc-dependent metalloprotease n=1 Tax=Ferruginibacter sp. TaxID=1940288 RepID=UPI0026598170|nr:zinc-dependent metalloprotease [Ferruginibacter sp.]MDB5278038.1 type sorting protein [Ferruginibacter sp.]
MKNWALLLILVLPEVYCYAQYTCGTDDQHTWLLKHNAAYLGQMQTKRPALRNSYRPATIPDTIPVVVHVIYLVNTFGAFGDISDSSIANMMENLNQSFNQPTPGGTNIGLYFMLAQTDPDCRPTKGIIRVDASGDKEYVLHGVHMGNAAGGISQEALAAKSFWDNTKYLNIWIVYQFSDQNVGGYAFYPTGFHTVFDGVVLSYNAAWHSVVHEVGHAFDLFHTFQGADGTTCSSNTDCSVDGDMICDIPPVLQTNVCDPSAVNPCTAAPYGSNAVYNHMSYNECRHLFTPMQRDRMLNALHAYRTSLLTANTEWPPPVAPVIRIVADDADNVIEKNQLVTFTPTVTGSAAVQYHWLKNNYEVSTSRVYSTTNLLHGDEIVCMIEATDLACHVPVKSVSNTIKISTDRQHFVSIYPNPFYNKITAWTPSESSTISAIRLFAVDGKLLETKIFTPSSIVQYSMVSRPAGIYLLEFTTSKGRELIRAIKGAVKFF